MDSRKLKTISLVIVKIIFIVGAFALVFRKINVDKFSHYIFELHGGYFLMALLVSNMSLVFSAMRSRYYFHENGLYLRKGFSVMIYYIGYFFNILLPGGIGGDGLKVFYLYKLEKFSKIKSLKVILNERVNGFYALIVLGFLIIYHTSFAEVIQHSVLLNTVLLVLVAPVYFWGVKYVLQDKIKVAMNASIYSFMIQILQVISAYFLILSFGILDLNSIEIANYIYLFIVASVMTVIPITIGGIGIRELVFLYGMELIDYGNVEAAVAYAFLNFVIYVLTSIPGMFLLYRVGKIQRLTSNKMKTWWK